ncbi:hypothetical protein ZOSMA_165G00050 [Zostera marina]|uniref:Uncharacterized protein n=1 Tax=Zostera marina TaxID=29655 RepID=A0A0K9PVV2_ZOSMR|nr:hypothetical protein ZOSMA_165G00050 [Zostera marina]
MEDTRSSFSSKKNSSSGHSKTPPINNDLSGEANIENIYGSGIFSNNFDEKSSFTNFESPGPLHDIIVCWLHQHESGSSASKFLLWNS